MVSHLPAWRPSKVAPSTGPLPSATSKDVTSSFLSLAGLKLDRVLENGARLYSMDLKDLSKAQPVSKRAKKNAAVEQSGKFL